MSGTTRAWASSALLGAAIGVTLAGCGSSKPQLVQGDCQTMNGASVCTWGEMQGKDLVSFGATIPVAARVAKHSHGSGVKMNDPFLSAPHKRLWCWSREWWC